MAEFDAKAVADTLAAIRSDEELADLIHHLGDLLAARLHGKPRDGSPLKRVMDAARIEVRSWTTGRQRQIEEYLRR